MLHCPISTLSGINILLSSLPTPHWPTVFQHWKTCKNKFGFSVNFQMSFGFFWVFENQREIWAIGTMSTAKKMMHPLLLRPVLSSIYNTDLYLGVVFIMCDHICHHVVYTYDLNTADTRRNMWLLVAWHSNKKIRENERKQQK